MPPWTCCDLDSVSPTLCAITVGLYCGADLGDSSISNQVENDQKTSVRIRKTGMEAQWHLSRGAVVAWYAFDMGVYVYKYIYIYIHIYMYGVRRLYEPWFM